jgi:glycerol-3-phosphate acyltransferase PlsY
MMGILAVIAAYLIGGIPFGYFLVRWTTGRDVRDEGSGNIGATNVLRTTGKAAGIATLVLDALKGMAAVWIASRLTGGSVTWMSLAGLAVMLGHSFPIFLKFQGGKAVATFTGAFLYLTPVPLLAVAVVFFLIVGRTRYISAGSVIAAGTFPLGVWLILHPPAVVVLVATLAAALIIYRHRGNLDRLRAGTESVFRWDTA